MPEESQDNLNSLQEQIEDLPLFDDVCTSQDHELLERLYDRILEPREGRLSLPSVWDDKYRLKKYLGGGMSDVYLADQLGEDDREVVVKILPVVADDGGRKLKLFRAEYETLAMASEQEADGIVFPVDFSVFEEHAYFVMEHVAGMTLAECIGKAHLSVDDAVQVTAQAAQSLANAHGLGIVHGDIKPTNMILQPNGSVKLIDFGLSPFFLDTDRSRFGGTLQYAAPEQLSGTEVDARTDIYCLGVVLRKLIEAADSTRKAARSEDQNRIAKEVTKLADEMTAYVKEQRPTSAELIAERLQQMAQPSDPPRASRTKLVVGLLGAVAFALLAWMVMGWSGSDAAEQRQAALDWIESKNGTYKIDESNHVYEVDLNNCWVGNEDVEQLNVFENLLYAQFANSDVDAEGVALLQQPIDTLVLAGTDTDDRIFPVLKQFRIVRLELSGTKISEEGLKQTPNPTQLEFLGLADNPMTDAIAPTIAGMKRLKILNLRSTKITANGLRTFQHLELKELDLGSCQIGDEAIAAVAKIPTLHRLVIEHCQNLTDDCIGDVLKLKNLKDLGVQGCKFSDESILRLGSLPELERLTLGESPDRDVESLQRQLGPKIRVY